MSSSPEPSLYRGGQAEFKEDEVVDRLFRIDPNKLFMFYGYFCFWTQTPHPIFEYSESAKKNFQKHWQADEYQLEEKKNLYKNSTWFDSRLHFQNFSHVN